MITIGSGAGLAVLLVAVASFGCPGQQTGKSLDPDTNPYEGLVQFCTEHVVGAPQPNGKASPHINWTGYYSTDPPDKVVGHYMKTLGSENHRKEGDDDTWRFPLDKPVRVLSVTNAKGTFPLGGGCTPPPGSARAVVIVSMMTRPD